LTGLRRLTGLKMQKIILIIIKTLLKSWFRQNISKKNYIFANPNKKDRVMEVIDKPKVKKVKKTKAVKEYNNSLEAILGLLKGKIFYDEDIFNFAK